MFKDEFIKMVSEQYKEEVELSKTFEFFCDYLKGIESEIKEEVELSEGEINFSYNTDSLSVLYHKRELSICEEGNHIEIIINEEIGDPDEHLRGVQYDVIIIVNDKPSSKHFSTYSLDELINVYLEQAFHPVKGYKFQK